MNHLNVGDLVKVRQSWDNLVSHIGLVTEWWDETPISENVTSKRFAYEVLMLHTQQREEFYDYQLELISESKEKKA
jgi:P2-related tail formation protein